MYIYYTQTHTLKHLLCTLRSVFFSTREYRSITVVASCLGLLSQWDINMNIIYFSQNMAFTRVLIFLLFFNKSQAGSPVFQFFKVWLSLKFNLRVYLISFLPYSRCRIDSWSGSKRSLPLPCSKLGSRGGQGRGRGKRVHVSQLH